MTSILRNCAIFRYFRFGILSILASVLVSCGGGAGTVGLATGVALFTSAPSAVSITVGTSASYTIGGGTPIYHASSGTPTVASVSIGSNGTTMIIVGVATGTTQITVTDAVGATVNLAVTVGNNGGGGTNTGTPLFITAASTVTIPVAGSDAFLIGGGTPPYVVSSNNSGVASVALVGDRVVVTGVATGTAQVLVFDSAGSSASTTYTVGAGGTSAPLFTSAASSIVVAVGGKNSYSVGGGTAPYMVSSNNPLVATGTIAGSTLSITGIANGSAQIIVTDSVGATVVITATVGTSSTGASLFTSAPSTVTLHIGAPASTFTVGGGTAPYLASSGDTGVATASINGTTLTLNAVSGGSAQVVVSDSAGATTTIAVTVPAIGGGIALFTTAPGAISLAIGGTGTYTVGGGTAPYTAVSGSPGVVSANLAGTVLALNGLAAGTGQISVFDSTGASVSATVTVASASSPVIAVQPDGATGNVGHTLSFVFTGGTAPYTASIADPSIATLSAITTNSNGGSFTATLLNTGSTNITIVDSTGQSHSLTLTATASSPSLLLSPSALLIAEDDTGNLTFQIYGGTAPYTALTSNQVLFSTSVTGSTLTVGLGSSTNRCVTPIDSTGTYIPYGTFPVTITVQDSLGATATAIITIQDNGLGSAGSDVPPPCH